ncbi:MAG: DNA (cytosine-5-)-methyltransferase [Candidatus Methanoperedens sp.]|nr:DNA (cytosine-5-)-methyltransferase [Candidatus Methanoperedens sp.]
MKFIDLFAGLGGFHLALSELGHDCIFACEINGELQDNYEKNFGFRPEGDIMEVRIDSIPSHDILCAGFPCQPFSKAGFQKGMKDKKRGALFDEIIKIIQCHHPEYLIMENVPNIRKHNSGRTWEYIEKQLRAEGYDISAMDLSPHHFGIPQIRLRTYIVGKKGGLDGFIWPEPNEHNSKPNIIAILDKNPEDARKLPQKVRDCFSVWQEFLDIVPNDEEIPHPLWAMEFGATYPYERTTPHSMSLKALREYKGSFGAPIVGKRRKEIYRCLPSHASRANKNFPEWKICMIKRNREFYMRNKKLLGHWIQKVKQFPSSFQKLEWNVGDGPRDMKLYIIQCRASGIRVKRPTTSPSLVAMNNTQIPIISWENRYMTLHECASLQSMEKLSHLPINASKAYRALGNAVNVNVVRLITSSLLNNEVEKHGK